MTLIVESGIDSLTNPPTGVGFVDLECDELRFYDSDTIKFLASGSADERNAYLTINAVQVSIPPSLPPVPPSSSLGYYHLFGFSTPDGSNVLYDPGAIIPINFGDTTIFSEDVIVNDINGDGSEFEVMTPGTYHILIKYPSSVGVTGLTLNGTIIIQTPIMSTFMTNIDCVIQITAGDIISLKNIDTTIFITSITGSYGGIRAYSSIFFDRLTSI